MPQRWRRTGNGRLHLQPEALPGTQGDDTGGAGGHRGGQTGNHHAAGEGSVQPLTEAGGGHFQGRGGPY